MVFLQKLTSRKFAVWVIGCVFSVVAIVMTKTVTPELINFVMVNNLIYTGANSITRWIDSKKGE